MSDSPSASSGTLTANSAENDPRAPLLARNDTAVLKARAQELKHPRGKTVLTEDDCYEELGFAWPARKKWSILVVVFLVQMSMNFNSSVITGAVPLISERYDVSEQVARVAQMIMLICYAFGCELWAPWSEEFGRRPILQLSLFLVNIFQLPCALAGDSLGLLFFGRAMIGLCSAGGSVTLGMVADMWEPDNQQFAVAFVVLSSVGGSTIGAVFAGLIQENLPLEWNFWIQLIFGLVVQILHLIFVPETRVTCLLDESAKRHRAEAQAGRRSVDDLNVYGPNEIKEPRIDMHEVKTIWSRPAIMFVKEPIVLFLSLLSGFSDALIFTFFEGFKKVYDQYDFTPTQLGWVFWSVELGYLLGYLSFLPWIRRDRQLQKRGIQFQPERRLFWLLFLAPLEPIFLFAFAWTSTGPPIPWQVPTALAVFIGAANFAIYHATVDYMIAAYGPYSASATGGNGFARDFLAGVAALYSSPLYSTFDPYPRAYASSLLGCIAVVVAVPIYIFYWRGPQIRAASRFAQTLEADRVAHRKVRDLGTEPLIPHPEEVLVEHHGHGHGHREDATSTGTSYGAIRNE
ncbi:major facilitator superfamily transporter [Xylariomycetidae sp. FL2044]|nr:major facilitator superfamily transporter [Xylariomycetidae sp. FL2044]